MAWEISHSQEAWDNARYNLTKWDKERLINALVDDTYEAAEANEEDAESAADARRIALSDLPEDMLVEACMNSIAAHMTCDNGGFNFWIDREGYHTVSVDKQEE